MNQISRIGRRHFLGQALALAAVVGLPGCASRPKARRPIPVILGTDIGDDIDDTWALGFLLRCPELDLKLVYGDYGKSEYRAKLIAKFLQTVGRGDVPVALGMKSGPTGDGPQAAWIRDYDLTKYPGKVNQDGAQAIIDTIRQSTEPVTVISIAPAPTLAAALKRDPEIARRASMAGMYGSVRTGYNGHAPEPEWNVKAAVSACQTVFAAPWQKTITPLDTCGLVKIDGAPYQKVANSSDPIAATVIKNYRIWAEASKDTDLGRNHSTTLFDTVAVYLAFAQDFCQMEELGIRITDDGMTVIDPAAQRASVATAWKNLDGFYDLLTTRLTNGDGRH